MSRNIHRNKQTYSKSYLLSSIHIADSDSPQKRLDVDVGVNVGVSNESKLLTSYKKLYFTTAKLNSNLETKIYNYTELLKTYSGYGKLSLIKGHKYKLKTDYLKAAELFPKQWKKWYIFIRRRKKINRRKK